MPTQSAVNSSVWRAGRYLYAYDNRVLEPAEVKILVRYGPQLTGRVLDLGCGGGRVLSYLVRIGADAYGLDISAAMVEHCRRTIPGAKVILGDVASLKEHVTGRFDAILAPDNLLDVFSDAERRLVLGQIHELLEPDGILIFSSHDLAHIDEPRTARAARGSMLRRLVTSSPVELVRGVVGRFVAVRNRRRLAPLQERHADHAIVNDPSHNYSLLHYYIRRDDEERQLNELGYDLIECLDTEGNTVPAGGSGRVDYLHYVARPREEGYSANGNLRH
jgi:SAM-dependent methyltransferase